MANFDIEISEVGPRDGLQSIKTIMPTEAKKAWIKAEYEAGVPEIARYDVINVGQTPKEHIENSLALEMKGVVTYNEAVQLAASEKDAGSKDLMERMVVESEESIDWAESQLELIESVGLKNYLAQQMGEKPAE